MNFKFIDKKDKMDILGSNFMKEVSETIKSTV